MASNGFTRRYGGWPGTEVLTQIEGIVIIDLPPPGPTAGTNTGVVCVVGEFVDMTYATKVSATGIITTDPRPVEVRGGQDLLNAVGGFDERLGEFGGDCGNGFVEVRNKTFARLVLQPVDILTTSSGSGDQGALRVYRDLPTNQSATVPQPIVPVTAATIAAGTTFTDGTNRCRTASAIVFTDFIAYESGTDGATSAGAAVTNTFSSASGDFVNRGVQVGDILVFGIKGTGAGGTYRVTAVTGATDIVVQAMDGSSFDFGTTTAQPWRLHAGSTADSSPGHVAVATNTGYNVLARPLTATLAAAAAITPLVVAPASSATVWEPLSGLAGFTHPTQALTYEAAVHAANAANNSTLATRYASAIDATVSDDAPARDINIVTSARKYSTIRTKLKASVLAASARGLTRRAVLSPSADYNTFNNVIGDSGSGVGVNRSDRLDYSWPGAQTSIPEANGFTIATSDGKTTTDGILDTTCDTWLASVESMLAPERNPGQLTDPIPLCLAPILGFARGTPKLGMPEYTAMRAAGICGLKFDATAGPIFQSGVTTSLVAGQKNISRRRMADFIQDSAARLVLPLSKQPMSENIKDTAVGSVTGFLSDLLSADNPLRQRIKGYDPIDDRSGNTEELEAQGVFVMVTTVKLLSTMDVIVLQTNIGEGVVLSAAA